MRLARVNVIRLDSRGDCPPSGGTSGGNTPPVHDTSTRCAYCVGSVGSPLRRLRDTVCTVQSAPSDDGVVVVATSPARLAAGRAVWKGESE